MVLCWRAWGDTDAAARALRALSPPPNLKLARSGPNGMPDLFRSAHAVVCAYTPGFGKSAPNSILEGLACGRPALVTEGCAVGEMIAAGGAGVVVPRSSERLAAGIETLRASYAAFASSARRLAETRFDQARFCAEYGALYEELTALAALKRRAPVGLSAPGARLWEP
jgi:glycosyltransferase involved in cell wall biosynthesis